MSGLSPGPALGTPARVLVKSGNMPGRVQDPVLTSRCESLRRICEEARLLFCRPQVRKDVLYSLRHTMATLGLVDSKDLKLVASRLGHTSEHLVL